MKFTQNSLLKVQHASDAFDRQLMHTLISTSFRGHTRSILLRLGSTLEEGHVKGLYIITFSKKSICMRYNILCTTLYTRIRLSNVCCKSMANLVKLLPAKGPAPHPTEIPVVTENELPS